MWVIKILSQAVYLFHNAYDRFVLQPMYKNMLGFCGKNVTMRNLKGVTERSMRRMYSHDNVVLKSFNQ